MAKTEEEKRQYRREYYQKNKEKINAQNKAWALANPERAKKNANERTKRYYQRNLEKCREKNRIAAVERHKRDPKIKKNNALKSNFGISLEEWNELFASQGYKCAICLTDEHGTKTNWNTDHCHVTGKVRFILCPHCNRGLGAFKDDPKLMRKAADMLEEFYKKETK